MQARKLLLIPSLLVLVTAIASAGVIEKKHPDGTPRLKYEIDEKGDKDGAYEEFHPNGKAKVKAVYKGDKLEGPYKSFHENGKPYVTAVYRDGELTGSYLEETEQGQKKLTATYKEGKLNGPLTHFEKGKPTLTVVYKDGEASQKRSLPEMKKKLAEIAASKVPGADPEMAAALNRLKAYRYLAEVPYENMELDAELAKGTLAAAKICEKLGRLDHYPKNPGLPEAEYQLAAEGAKSSNLAQGLRQVDRCVDAWMADSDPSNIAMLGHRRWCIHPAMQKTGFGKSGIFVGMWTLDRSQSNVPDFDVVAFPPRGLMPVEYFGPEHAWSVSLNPRKFKAAPDNTSVKIIPVDTMLNKTGEPLRLNYNKPNNNPFGLPSCLIFRPDRSAVVPGRRYLVEIDGLTRTDGKPGQLSYVVEFVSLR